MSEFGEEQDMDDFEAALGLGRTVLDMCDRLRPIAQLAPGSRAAYGFEIDGACYQLTLEMAGPVSGSSPIADSDGDVGI